MHKIGLLGKNISYSFSKPYFENKFKTEGIVDWNYSVFDLDSIDQINTVFDIEGLKGFNITIPYKEAIIPYLDELDDTAKNIGAVNTVLIKNNKKIGYNTDCIGFINSAKVHISKIHNPKALILGTGGASKAIAYSLKTLSIPFNFVSRKKRGDIFDYEDTFLEKNSDFNIVINCTPIGTFPEVSEAPNVNFKLFNNNSLAFDLIYNPEKTLFLQTAEKGGAIIQNGYPMLVGQAEASWNIWNKTT